MMTAVDLSTVPTIGPLHMPMLQGAPDRLQIRVQTTPARVDIRYRPFQVQVDTSEARAELGFSGPLRSGREFAAQSQSEYIRNLAAMVDEGNRLAAIEKGGTIADAAAAKAPGGSPPGEKAFQSQVALIPSTPADIEFLGGGVDVQATGASVQISFVRQGDKPSLREQVVEFYRTQHFQDVVWTQSVNQTA
ncbi:MAG: hypothetical protein IMW99_00935 [Firmicutes bacterium]|nr:hypothetical protein [Bacillota bacterium]